MPIVVTTQEDKGTTYITIHVDKHPQLLINNGCAFKILVGQANAESSESCVAVEQVLFLSHIEYKIGKEKFFRKPFKRYVRLRIFLAGILSESAHFSWICDVESGGSCHYSLPAIGNRLPDSPALSVVPLLLLTAIPNNGNPISGGYLLR